MPEASPAQHRFSLKVNSFSQGCYLGVLAAWAPWPAPLSPCAWRRSRPPMSTSSTFPHCCATIPIPDRSSAYMRRRESPPYMVEGVRFLERAGAADRHSVQYRAPLVRPDRGRHRLPVLHIIEAVIDDLRRLGLPKGRIGLMGTAATLKLGLYQRHLEAQGYECLVPDEDEVERYCMGSIRAVKGNQLEQAYSPAAECIARLKARCRRRGPGLHRTAAGRAARTASRPGHHAHRFDRCAGARRHRPLPGRRAARPHRGLSRPPFPASRIKSAPRGAPTLAGKLVSRPGRLCGPRH